MIHEAINIDDRKPIWIALSEFYLDTELEESDIKYIAETILKSPYSLEEVKEIDKYEVFPVLIPNLLSTAGNWAGFNEDWLLEKIQSYLKKNSSLNRMTTEIFYKLFQWIGNDYWKKLEVIYHELKLNS
jgi:hypothetical protein